MKQMLIRLVVSLSVIASAVAQHSQGDGIVVGEPKAFDSRTLTLRLEELQRRLAELRSLDQAGVRAGLGKISNLGITESGLKVSAGQRIPQVVTTEKPVEGVLRPESIVTTQSGKDLEPPTGNSEAGLSAGELKPELSAADRLSEMLNLEYQVVTIQSFLERSVTDRLSRKGANGVPRLQGLLGVPISITPPKGTDGHVARVELRVKPCVVDSGKLSVVALMPPQKAYNTLAISKTQNAFGGAAMLGMVPLGASWFGRRQLAFVYQASDTEAYLLPDQSGAVRFGWEFRPVLGRKAVAPGMRQMLALLALPRPDEGEDPYDLCVTWDAQWLRFNESRGTVLPPTPSHSDPQSARALWTVPIDTSLGIQKALTPSVDDVTFSPVGADRFVTAITGKGFFSGTKIVYGDLVASDPASGLEITSDTTMRLTGRISHLLTGYPAIQGRYGTSTEIFNGPAAQRHPAGFVVASAMFSIPTARSEYLTLDVTLAPYVRPAQPLIAPMPMHGYVAALEEKLLPTTVPVKTAKCPAPEQLPIVDGYVFMQGSHCVHLQYQVAADQMKSPATLTLLHPFRGPRWTARHALDPFPPQLTLTRLGKGDVCSFVPEPTVCRSERVRERQQVLDSLAKTAAANRSANDKAFQVDEARYAVWQKRAALLEQRRFALGLVGGSRTPAALDAEWDKTLREVNRIASEDLKKAVDAIFTGEPAKAKKALEENQKAVAPATVPAEDDHVVLALTGRFVNPCFRVLVAGLDISAAGAVPLPGPEASTLFLSAPESLLQKFEQVTVLRREEGTKGKCDGSQPDPVVLLKIPSPAEAQKPPAPAFQTPQALTARKSTAPLLVVQGSHLDRVKLVRFADKVLTMIPGEKGKSFSVALTREVTANEGPAVLLLDTEDGKTMSLIVDVKP
jgi:hypothetical protein